MGRDAALTKVVGRSGPKSSSLAAGNARGNARGDACGNGTGLSLPAP